MVCNKDCWNYPKKDSTLQGSSVRDKMNDISTLNNMKTLKYVLSHIFSIIVINHLFQNPENE